VEVSGAIAGQSADESVPRGLLVPVRRAPVGSADTDLLGWSPDARKLTNVGFIKSCRWAHPAGISATPCRILQSTVSGSQIPSVWWI